MMVNIRDLKFNSSVMFNDFCYVKKLVFRVNGICEVYQDNEDRNPIMLSEMDGVYLETGYPIYDGCAPLMIPDKNLTVLTETEDGNFIEGPRNLVSAKVISVGANSDETGVTTLSLVGLRHEELEEFYRLKYPNYDIEDNILEHVSADMKVYDEIIEECKKFKDGIGKSESSSMRPTSLF